MGILYSMFQKCFSFDNLYTIVPYGVHNGSPDFDNYGCDTCVATMVSKKRECSCVTCDKLISGIMVCCSTCKNNSACQNATDIRVVRLATFDHQIWFKSTSKICTQLCLNDGVYIWECYKIWQL